MATRRKNTRRQAAGKSPAPRAAPLNLLGKPLGALGQLPVSDGGLRRASDEVEPQVWGRAAEVVRTEGPLRAEISERHCPGSAPRDSEECYRLLFACHPHPMWVCDQETRSFLDVNEAAVRHYGYAREEFLSMTIEDIRPPEDLPRLLAFQPKVGPQEIGVWRHRKKDGAIIEVELATHDLLFRGRWAWLVAVNDVTERWRAEAALKGSEANYRAIFDAANDAIFIHDPETGTILDANLRMCELYGCDPAQIRRLNVQDLSAGVPPYTQEAALAWIQKAAAGEPQLFEWLAKDRQGRLFWVEVHLKRAAIGGHHRLLAIVRDITGRKRAEAQLVEQAALLNHTQEAIIVRDLEGGVRFWNCGAERLYGYTAEEVIGRPVRELLYRNMAQLDEALRVVVERGEWAGELDQVTKGGKEITVESSWSLVRDERGRPKSVLAINTDVTEKKRLEAQLQRAQRLESIGTLAGGIAHDLNNILSPILMAVYMLQQKFTDEDSQRCLGTLRASASRGADLIKQVLTFARGSEGRRAEFSPKHLIKELVKMLADTLPKSIEIHSAVDPGLWEVCGDATQLYQVLMNLCVNARDAMPRGGRLTIQAENTRLDEAYARMRFGAGAGRFVQLTIADTGTGVPPEIIDKIFDPFFTTKEVGQGTGLGLSTVLGIVKGHGGLIEVESKVGQGTVFKIYFPAVESRESKPSEEEGRELPAGGGELILVVDDEAAIREIAKEALKAHGYRVLTAEDGPEAVKQCAERRGEVKAVLLDLMMPVMSGPATIRALRRLDAHLQIIATSGLPGEDRVREAAQAGAQAFLPKPFAAEQLLAALAEVLTTR